MATGQLGGRLLAVTGMGDGKVALWRADEEGLARAGDPQPCHDSAVVAVAVSQLGGRLMAVTGGYDGTVALWQVRGDGLVRLGDPQPCHDGSGRPGVSAVAVGELGGLLVAATGGLDGTLRLWRVDVAGLVSIPAARVPIGSPAGSVTGTLPPTAVLAWCSDGVLTAEMPTSQT